MQQSNPPYPESYREKILSLHKSGRSIASLAREFEPSATTIRTWIKQAQSVRSTESATPDDAHVELQRLHQKVAELMMERETIKACATAFAEKSERKSRSGS